MDRKSSVCVVLVTFNRKDLLIECVRALLRQTRPVDCILIVDNGSTDGTLALLESTGLTREPLVQVHQEPRNLGGAGGFASGMKRAFEAGYDWAWLMDDDAEAAQDALAEALSHEQEPSAVAIANFKISPQGVPQDAHMLLSSGGAAKHFKGQRQAQELSFSSFVGLLVRRETIAAVGLPKAELFINRDDNEYSLRMRKAGRILLAPSSIITHKEAALPTGARRKLLFLSSQRYPLQKFIIRYFEMRNTLWLYGMEHGRVGMLFLGMRRAISYIAFVLLFRDDRPLLRILVIIKAHLDGLRPKFDNDFPFRLLRELKAGK
jgi:rhamnopyranosyl-N-acetylglucosaminyl-diphospho-decaprenol beta-1,3/1,4-galactofuranosyltransferase